MKQRRHPRTWAAVCRHVFVRVQDAVGLGVEQRVVIASVLSPVCDAREEGDDEGQQAETYTQQSKLGVPALLPFATVFLKAVEHRSCYILGIESK